MLAKILFDDLAGRFKAGEIGNVLPNDFSKYDFKLDFGDGELITDGFLKGIIPRRIFYFYKDEVEVMQ